MALEPCRKECEKLIALAKTAIGKSPAAEEHLRPWLEKAASLLEARDLESLGGERALNALALTLRFSWLRYAQGYTAAVLKSPSQLNSFKMPISGSGATPYDRWNKADYLEGRCARYRPAPAGWEGDHVLFSSGMSAFSTFLQLCKHRFQSKPGAPLKLWGFGGYFEFDDLFRLLCDSTFVARMFNGQKDFQKAIARGDGHIVLFEPVACRHDLAVFDAHGFIRAWKEAPPGLPPVLIIDTTLVGNRFPLETFLDGLGDRQPALVAVISSGLKLDQQGLEFANLGILSVFSQKNARGGRAQKTATALRHYRRTVGGALALEALSALEFPAVLDKGLFADHCRSVFDNNAQVAKNINTGGGILESVTHPALGSLAAPWAVAPFVNLRFQDAGRAEKELLKYVIAYESKVRGIPFVPGTSFGFRGHRFEMALPIGPNQATMRIALGCRNGPALQEIVKLINQVAAFPNFKALSGAYPELAKKASEGLALQTNS